MAVYLQTHVGQEQIGVIASDLTEAKNIWHGEIHSHAAYELQILLGGSCQVEVDGTKYTVPVHHALITAPNIHHKTLSVDGTYERYGMLFAVEEGPLQQALQEEVPVCKVYPVTEETEALCRYIFLEWDRRPADVRSFLQSQMALLLQNNFRLLGVSCYKQSDSVWPSGRLYTYLIDTFFSSHLTEGSCLDALAEDLHLSRSQVNRVIKEHYGISFREKLVQVRMTRAAWLLCHSDCRIDEIAAQVGYRSSSSFHEMFRRRFGVSPEQYRRESRE